MCNQERLSETLDLMATVYGLHPLLSIPKERTIVVILPGLQRWRLTHANWQDYGTRLWVAGTSGDPAYSEAEVRGLIERNGHKLSDFRFQGFARHTPDQMDWVAAELAALPPGSYEQVVLMTAGYHLPRCTLTFAMSKARKPFDHGFHFGACALTAPDISKLFGRDESLADEATRDSSDSVLAEAERVMRYQDAGHVASRHIFEAFIQRHRY